MAEQQTGQSETASRPILRSYPMAASSLMCSAIMRHFNMAEYILRKVARLEADEPLFWAASGWLAGGLFSGWRLRVAAKRVLPWVAMYAVSGKPSLYRTENFVGIMPMRCTLRDIESLGG